jgi:hypothetical protein
VQSNAITEDIDTSREVGNGRAIDGEQRLTVVVEVDCSPRFWENADEIVARTFTEAA